MIAPFAIRAFLSLVLPALAAAGVHAQTTISAGILIPHTVVVEPSLHNDYEKAEAAARKKQSTLLTAVTALEAGMDSAGRSNTGKRSAIRHMRETYGEYSFRNSVSYTESEKLKK